MYSNKYNTTLQTQDSGVINMLSGIGTWALISFILAIVGGILVYFLFVRSKKDFKENKVLEWLRKFLDFKTLWIEVILKISYAVFAIFITLSSFALISINFLSFIGMLFFGNLILRLAYEGSMVLLMIWRNTADLNKKMKEPKEKDNK